MNNPPFARHLHSEMIDSLFANQDARQAQAVKTHEAQLAEQREREAQLAMPQPIARPAAPQRLPKRLEETLGQIQPEV